MDLITHILVGLLIARLGFNKRSDYIVILVSTIAPDIDYITWLFGTDLFLNYHKGITHGIFALVVFSIASASYIRYRYQKALPYYLFLCAISYGAHILLDLVEPTGVRIFSPLDDNVYSLDLIAHIDPYLILIIFSALVLGWILRERMRLIALLAFLSIILYIDGRYLIKKKAMETLRAGMDEKEYRLTSIPGGIMRWWFVSRTDDNLNAGIVDLFMDKIIVVGTYKYSEGQPEILISKGSQVVRNFLRFAKFPVVTFEEKNGESIVRWQELSYSYLPGERFTATVRFDNQGRMRESYFRF